MATTTATVTQSQIDACDRYEHNGQVYYLVASSSNPGTHYRVFFNRQFGVLQCAAHDGEACPASVKGLVCWHKRAAVEAEKGHRALIAAEKQAEARIAEESRPVAETAEQARIEDLVRQGLDRPSAERVVYAKPAPVGNAKPFQAKAFSLMA